MNRIDYDENFHIVFFLKQFILSSLEGNYGKGTPLSYKEVPIRKLHQEQNRRILNLVVIHRSPLIFSW